MSSFNKQFYRLYPILIMVFILSGCCAVGELKHDDLCIPDCRECSCKCIDGEHCLDWDKLAEKYIEENL